MIDTIETNIINRIFNFKESHYYILSNYINATITNNIVYK